MRSPILTDIKILLTAAFASFFLPGCVCFPSKPPAVESSAAAQKDADAVAPRTEDIVGSWIEDATGQSGRKQGYKFNADGTASSIGMATLDAKRWILKGDRLTIFGSSIGNGMTISFEFEFLVTHYSADTLELEQGSYRHRLKRR